ncbi:MULTISPECIES: hypothetical protein [Clostridium]|uniref:hypothetical protein n=1 Tax=Clostridium TaxID=1485 RepID=UPI00069E22CB|nr:MULTISPECIES: hypothetical protein [Clostridium]KOF56176.1 hypothetical protein AGR56_04530 [Clostridium sp. DMHC 10]MCD2348232.1 hypothetical protein [Clostridium guangxiense]
MKKIICFFISLFFIFNLTGCVKKKDKITNVNEFEITKANKLVESYIKYYMKNDFTSMDYMYSKDFKSKVKKQNEPSLKITGYKIMDSTEMGTKANIKANVISVDETSPYSSTDVYTFKVKKEKGAYVIDSIETNNEKEVYIYKRSLMVRARDEAMSNVLINLRGIPEYYFQKSDIANIDKLKVSKDGFKNINLSYTGDNIAISTQGANAFVAVCPITDLQQQSGGSDQGGGGGQGGTSGVSQIEGMGSTQDDLQPLKVSAQALTAIDVYKDSEVQKMAFSRDEKNIAVQYKSGDGTNFKIYAIQTGKPLSENIEKRFQKEKVDLKVNMFDDENLIFESSPKDKYANDYSVKKLAGMWKWNIKTQKVERQNE